VAARFCQHCAYPIAAAPAIQVTASALLPGTVLCGRYAVVRKLGAGGMGAVYLADDRRIGSKQWAVKEMSDLSIADPSERQIATAAFQQEAQLLAALDHTNLPKVVDYFSEHGNQYLVMEFVQGQTLEKRLEGARGPLLESEVRVYAEQICDVLDYLHTRPSPVIFRDLKPANIMLQTGARIKLIDFGIARHFKPGKAKDTQAMGTPGYAAPEQYGKGQSDARSDIYALGATLHHMLTGRDPSSDPFNFTPVRALNPAVSANFDAAVNRCVQLQADQRWQSVREVRKVLATAAPAPSVPKATVVAPVKPAPVIPKPIVVAPVKPALNPAILPPLTTTPHSATPANVTPPANPFAIKRAGVLWFLVVVFAVGAWLASPYSPMVFLGWSMGGGIIVPTLLLAYLLTHRAGSVFVTAALLLALEALGLRSYFGYIPGLFILAQAALVEGMLALTRWRTRNSFGLALIGFLATILPVFVGMYYGGDLISIGIGSVVGTAAALIISSLVNSVSGIGK